MVKLFKIVIDEVAPEHKVHPTGVPLTGSVIVETTKTEDYKEIKVSLKGKGEVEWKEWVGAGDERREEEYDEKEKFLSKEVVVWKKSKSPDGCFPAGEHRFSFQFDIPVGTPSSFKSDVGEIRYHIKAKIDQPGKDDKVKQTVKIADFVDANESSLQNPVRKEKTKEIGFLCCAAGSVNYTLEVPRTGYNVKGDSIQILVNIENGSSREVVMDAKLFKNIAYTADGHHRYRQETVLEEKSEVIPEHSSGTDWASSKLVIPDIPVTMTRPKIIKITYVLRVCAEIPYALDPTVDIPVTIGNANLFRQPS